MKVRAIAAATLAMVLVGCSQAPPPEGAAEPSTTPDAVAAPTSENASLRFIGLIGTKAQHAPPFLGVPQTNFYCLRSFVDRRTGETRHQLYVSDSYSGAEHHWNAARDDEGRPLRFIEIGRHQITCEGDCSYVEEFAATIPESELRAHPQGFALTFTASSGAEKRIVVSSAQISGQFAALDRSRNLAQPAAVSSEPAAPAKPHQ